MDNRTAVREFLISRRGRVTPAQAGLPGTARRRVPGLRREEVAVLAGVSTEWYTRLEKGHIRDVSYDVLDAVARALRLDDEERIYLFDLARTARAETPDSAARDCRTVAATEVELPETVQWLLDSMTLSSAMVSNKRLDVLAINPLGRALYAPMFESPESADPGTGAARPNLARYHFLAPGSRDFYANWDVTADVLVGLLRTEAGRAHCDQSLHRLVTELCDVSADFRTRWQAHNIVIHNRGTKVFRHPFAGPLTLAYHSVHVPISVQETQMLTVCTARPRSADEDRLRLLASWSAPAPAGSMADHPVAD
ncbi:helix-turn-helix domain-containing protein [Actinoplanes sp. N902-109]|uniref:helix-turn-helix domain-containing protein n=1 Tax=Actinoplanes sp. (strain N902-109) TaxID=649831 RepID=UPI0003295C0A|nr:helix-turn-helix transcriptional regulator [Actinoplanes sp. N902-109]AGL18405.1 putative transcriptional regulator [Actinoplanes sp. N902-109]